MLKVVRLKKRDRNVFEWLTGCSTDLATQSTCCAYIPGAMVQALANHCGKSQRPSAIRQSIQKGNDQSARKIASSASARRPTRGRPRPEVKSRHSSRLLRQGQCARQYQNIFS